MLILIIRMRGRDLISVDEAGAIVDQNFDYLNVVTRCI